MVSKSKKGNPSKISVLGPTKPKRVSSFGSRRRTPNLYYPWKATILGLDPATVQSGYCLVDCGGYISSGWFTSCHNQIAETIRHAIRSSIYHKNPLVVVCEDWFGSVKVVKALCEERGRWLQEFEKQTAQYRVTSSFAVVHASTWANAYGLPKTSAARKKASVAIANTLTNHRREITNDNEADAILIANFASKWSGLSKLKLTPNKIEGVCGI